MIVILFCFQVTEPSCCTGDLTHLCSQVTISGEMSKEDSVQFIRKAVEGVQRLIIIIMLTLKIFSATGWLKLHGKGLPSTVLGHRAWFYGCWCLNCLSTVAESHGLGTKICLLIWFGHILYTKIFSIQEYDDLKKIWSSILLDIFCSSSVFQSWTCPVLGFPWCMCKCHNLSLL